MNCPFCHKNVPLWWYYFHVKGHRRLKADGQHESHITLHPELREQGSLEGVPKVYEHPKCGGMTVMPEKIIRSYLKNPFMYNGKTFCTGCHTYVDDSELFWVETGQRMSEYRLELQRNAR
ncbi:hypothetical protein CCAX7_46720 [Capsulimonas corticalis]|uniref:Uncharacterized protein n=1 Tax=Capsulimonas corticalis TaxID=2219043 RepID=A0A402CQP7_9BACT|nr:hypothetical protein CCAX7_46720 [Capsulimonas corticalis]